MKISFYDVEKLPVAKIENYYNEQELNLIWKELDFIHSTGQMLGPEHTASATSQDGTFLKKNLGINLDGAYRGYRPLSNILRCNRKVFSHEIVSPLVENHKFFDYLNHSNHDSSLMSYYTNSGYYEPHTDVSTITAVTWLYKEPKGFEGGDFSIVNGPSFECSNNTTVIFPSILQHAVSEVKQINNNGFGRYVLVQLITSFPSMIEE